MLRIIFIVGLIIIIGFLIIYYYKIKDNEVDKFNNNFYMTNTGNQSPIYPEKRKRLWDYYGNYNNYLVDGYLSGRKIPPYSEAIPPYCDEPNRNRSYLVNPLLTQKHIFIKPNINSFDLDKAMPDFGNQAEQIRIGAFEELLVPQTNAWYSNFGKVYNAFKKPKIRKQFREDYIQRCGLSSDNIPKNVYNNPY